MWNQPFITAGPGAGGGAHSNMAHTSGSFATHSRHTSLTNSPSGHRHIGVGIGPAQHASPSANTAFPRPFANAPFPGTVTAPRFAAPPNSLSAQHRSIQYLPLLTTQTPASLAKLPFPANTIVHWQRFEHRTLESATAQVQQSDPAGSATTGSTSLAGSFHQLSSAWDAATQQLSASIRRARARSLQADTSEKSQEAAFKRLVAGPLIYSSLTDSTNAAATLQPGEPSCSATADLWLFIAVTGDAESASKASQSAGNTMGSTETQSGNLETAAPQAASKDGSKLSSTTQTPSTLAPTITAHLPNDIAKAVNRLAALAHVSVGSYSLANAATMAFGSKGKASTLTSEQSKAHKRFMASLKARVIDSIVSQSTAPSPDPEQQKKPSRSAHTRLRLGDKVVFLPPSRTTSVKTASSDASWFSTPRRAAIIADGEDQHSLITEVDVSLSSNSIFVRSTSRRLAALPLASTPLALAKAPAPSASASASAHATLLLSPLGCQAELSAVLPMSSLAEEHLAELRGLFATLTARAADTQPEESDLLASGLAICTLPSKQRVGRQTSQPQPQPQLHSHQQEQPDEPFAPGASLDISMDLDALPTIEQHEQQQQQQQHIQEQRQFLWPVSWCLVLQDHRTSAGRVPGAASQANDDLQNMRNQPMTPLKELVSFTLKVLNDANETSFAHNTAPYTPGEPDDPSLTRSRMDRLPSTRPDITPASMSFPDFDFAMPAAGSATPSQTLTAAGQSISSTSPAKREAASTEPGPGANNAEAFGEDLNWMQFLPQASEGPAPASASASAPPTSSARDMNFSASDQPTVPQGTTASHHPLALGGVDANSQQGGAADSAWAFSMGSSSAPPDAGAVAAADASTQAVVPSLLQPHGSMHSQGSTPFQGAQDTTPLDFARSGPTKRKAGETDIFGNLGLLTEDDFSFFDESAFGLEPDGNTGSLQPAALPHRPTSAMSHHSGFGSADMRTDLHPASTDVASGAVSRPGAATSATANPGAHSGAGSAIGINDVTMDDIGPNSLDALFSAIPGLQDVMVTSEPAQAQHAASMSMAPSTSAAQAVRSRIGHSDASDTSTTAVTSAHPFHPTLTSFTPRDASGATPFGDPASLPGFTPSSLTESSPAFGNQSHKTPRTPYSPAEEYRDGATIVGLHHVGRPGESVQSYRDRNAGHQAQDAAGSHTFDSHAKEEDQLRLADASTAAAAAAAANAAMESDTTSRKRPAIVPNAFLPLAQPEAKKPLQKLTAGARANLGRKYDLLGKFASKPKTTTAVTTVNNKSTDQRRVSNEASRPCDRVVDRASAPETGRVASSFGPMRASPSKTPSRRGQALLKLRRDRHSKASPGLGLLGVRRESLQRMVDVPATPRSSDDIAQFPGEVSDDDSDTSSSGDEDSEDAQSDVEGSGLVLSSEEQERLRGCSKEVVARFLRGDHARETVEKVEAAVMGSKPTVRRWLLSRTAEWLVENPQFRAMFGLSHGGSTGMEVAVGEKVEVLEVMASALSLSGVDSAKASTTDGETDVILPTLQSLVKRPTGADDHQGDNSLVQVLEPAKLAVGCQGSVLEALPSALMLWDKSNLSAVSGQKHIVAKVLLTHASPAWHDEIVSWLDRLRIAFESYGLGTHHGGASSILAVADTAEPLALSSYLDRLWKDGETWLDTLRSIASRISIDLLQGKHVVVYTLQPHNSATCRETGYHGLLRLEADLRGMLREQVGVLAEQVLVRVVSPEMVTEGGSLGLGKEMGGVRRLVMSVYDQLGRVVRRQPGKVLHGREGGAVSGAVHFPVWTLAGGEGRTKFELGSGVDPALSGDEGLILHVSYRILSSRDGGEGDSEVQEKLIVVSTIDERASSSTVDVITCSGDLETCIEKIWRFAIAQASRARLHWTLAISSAGIIIQREYAAWTRLIDAYLSATARKELVMDKVMLLSVRLDESGAILMEKGGKVRPSSENTLAGMGGEKVLLDASEFSQVLRFDGGLPMEWTLPFGFSSMEKEEGEDTVLPKTSAILVHKPRRDPFSLNTIGSGHVLAVDLIQSWNEQDSEKTEEEWMEKVLQSLHTLGLVSEERHQFPAPWNGQPWPQGCVNMLASMIGGVIVVD